MVNPNFEFDKSAKRNAAVAIVLIILLAAAVLTFGLYVKYISISEIGAKYVSVFFTNLSVKAIAHITSFLLIFVLFYVSTFAVDKISRPIDGILSKWLKSVWVKIILSVILSVFASAYVSETIYETYLLFAHSKEFGILDPFFGKDIGYYIFTRPFLASLVNSVLSVWLVVTLYCFVLYIINFSVNETMDLRCLTKDKATVIHNIVNVVIYFTLKAFTYKFKSQEILYSEFAGVAGAGYTDIYVWFNFYKVAPFLLLAIVALSIVFLSRAKYKPMIITVAVYPATLIAVSLISLYVQKFVVDPNEFTKEKPYLSYNLEFTKQAYNINEVITAEFSSDNNLTAQDIEDNKEVLNNVRITDFNSTLTAYNALQGIRDFYTFFDIDITKYNINGTPTLVMTAPREISQSKLKESNQNYTNRIFRYTHGFGAVMSPLNKVTGEGQPEFLVSNIPPVSKNGAPKIRQPRVYYGETADKDNYAIVNTSIKEIDYLEGASDKEFAYDGNGGLKLNFLNKIIFALDKFDYHILASNYITKDSKILINRNVADRVRKAVPFLTFDADPYLVVDSNGNLKWILDGYTTSEYYPYSQTYNGINYIRNSVKAVVDAYNGDVNVYLIDRNDPIIKCYMDIYPGVILDEEFPEDLKEHIIYPEYLFKIQSQVYGKYHVDSENSFYNRSDEWVFATEKYFNETKSIAPYYNLLKIDEFPESDCNFVLMIPYTLNGKENMTSWLAASCDYTNYGQMVCYRFPKGKNIYGTQQIESRIDNDPTISKELTLWSQGGSSVIRGNTLVVPIKNSLLYIEPIYITSSAAEGGIPELKKVILSYDDKVVMEDNLGECLKAIFNVSGDITEPEGAYKGNSYNISDEKLNSIIARLVENYDGLSIASKDGNWVAFGEKMSELAKTINELENYNGNTVSEDNNENSEN
ncbi:MAG: UPF0182 family protein [Oscillospiraceae bacterium]|nr:UPF0182 family protein [Oscillospiraceae bacterium]